MKENQHVKPIINVEAGTVTFQVKGHNDIVFDINKCHEIIVKRAALAGMAQVRIVDAAAVGMEDDEGNILPEAERIQLKYSRMEALVNHYHTGTSEWSRKGTGGGGFGSITVEAIARVKGVDYAAAEAMVANYAAKHYGGDTKKTLAELRKGKQVQEAMLAIRTERLPMAKLDGDAALAELDGE